MIDHNFGKARFPLVPAKPYRNHGSRYFYMCLRFHTVILIIQIRIDSGLSQNNTKHKLVKLCSGSECTTGRSKGWRLVCELCAHAQDAEESHLMKFGLIFIHHAIAAKFAKIDLVDSLQNKVRGQTKRHTILVFCRRVPFI